MRVGHARGEAEVFRGEASLGTVRYHVEVSGRGEVTGRVIHVEHLTVRASLAVPPSFLPLRAGLARDLVMRLADGRLVGFCVPSADGFMVNGRIKSDAQWRVVILPAEELTEQRIKAVRERFDLYLLNAGAFRSQMALFRAKRRAPDGRLPLYFSPACAVLHVPEQMWFRDLGAMPCEAPRAEDVEFVVGDNRAAEELGR